MRGEHTNLINIDEGRMSPSGGQCRAWGLVIEGTCNHLVTDVPWRSLLMCLTAEQSENPHSIARTSGKIPPFHNCVRGTLPWPRTCFFMSCCCWDSWGFASCCIGCGPTTAPQGIRE